jgi:hypothetical protein
VARELKLEDVAEDIQEHLRRAEELLASLE